MGLIERLFGKRRGRQLDNPAADVPRPAATKPSVPTKERPEVPNPPVRPAEPEYTQEEEGETRDGLFYASKLISGKKYKMQVAQASEAMCDAMRFIHLADWVEIWDGYGRHYLCDSVLVTPEWQTGAVASVAVEITTDTFVKSVGKGYITERQMTGIIGEAVIGVDFMIGA